MTDARSDPLVVVDWGTTRLRLWLVDSRAAPGDRLPAVESERGIATVSPGEHREVFLDALASLLDGRRVRDTLDVYLAGMITSTLGWYGTPYVEVPVGPRDLLDAVRHETIEPGAVPAIDAAIGIRLHFFPGARTREDVMRGEEVEVFGCLAAAGARRGEVVVALPGTHSKWIECRDGRVADFTTVPSGDVHAALHRESLFARTLPLRPVAVEGDLLALFDRGVATALEIGPLSAIFRTRSLSVLEGLPPEQCSAYLSGVLVGGEVAERLRSTGDRGIIVGGAPGLRSIYTRAIRAVAPRRDVTETDAGILGGILGLLDMG